MNKFRRYCPNVWIAECEEEYEKGDIIELETKYGKEVECEVYNFLGQGGNAEEPKYFYSVVRIEEQSYAERKAEKYGNAASNSMKKSNERWQAAEEGKDFLVLAEPIKVGHHSEKAHRALLERNWRRTEKAIEYMNKAEEQERKAKYWEAKAKEITLAMPESLEYYKFKLEEAEEHHQKLKENPELRSHSYSLAYAKKAVNEMKKKVEIAEQLWGEQEVEE